MQDQYRSMLLEQLFMQEVLEKLPHLGEGMVEACVTFFEKYDSHRAGRMDEEDFIRGMKVYGRLAKERQQPDAPTMGKRVELERAFKKISEGGNRAITVGEFVTWVALTPRHQAHKLIVVPETFAEACGFVKPADMEFLKPEEAQLEEAQQKKGRTKADINFLAEHTPTFETGGQRLDKFGRPVKKGGALLDKLADKAMQGYDHLEHFKEAHPIDAEALFHQQQAKRKAQQAANKGASFHRVGVERHGGLTHDRSAPKVDRDPPPGASFASLHPTAPKRPGGGGVPNFSRAHEKKAPPAKGAPPAHKGIHALGDKVHAWEQKMEGADGASKKGWTPPRRGTAPAPVGRGLV